MKLIFFLLTLALFVACNKNNDSQAGATGSGAGIEREEEYNDSDANITTPIDSRPDLEEED